MNAVDDTEVEVRRIPLAAITVDPEIQKRQLELHKRSLLITLRPCATASRSRPLTCSAPGTVSFISPTASIAWMPSGQRSPMRKKSNAGFIPAIATMRCCSPAARTRSTGCRAAASTRSKPSQRSCAASNGRDGVIARSVGNVGCRIGSSLPFVAAIWKNVQMPARRRTRPPPPRTPERPRHRTSHRVDDARSSAAAGVTA
jgi:hypothetical protein